MTDLRFPPLERPALFDTGAWTWAREVSDRLAFFETIPMPAGLWVRARETQLAMAAKGDHRRVPPANLVLAAAAEEADVELVHYDRDYERIAAVGALRHEWLVPEGRRSG